MSSKLRPDVIVNGEVAESRNDVALETPAVDRHSPRLHENADVLADSVGEDEPPGLFARFPKLQRCFERFRLQVVERREQRVLRDAERKQKLRLTLENQRFRADFLSFADQIVEVDVRRQVLLARIRQEVARDAMVRVRRRRPEPPYPRM